MDGVSAPMVGAWGASQVAAVGEFETRKKREIPAEDFSPEKKPMSPMNLASDVRGCAL
jgi:hypothetical protein